MYSNAGPWNDYELVKPLGIKKKGAIESEPQANGQEEEKKNEE